MIGIAVMTSLSIAAVAFYVRFLVALGREFRYERIRYLMRVQPSVTEVSVLAARREKAPAARAA
jgi:hypothetical protein